MRQKSLLIAMSAAAILGAAALSVPSTPAYAYQRPPKARRTKDQRARANAARKARKANKDRK